MFAWVIDAAVMGLIFEIYGLLVALSGFGGVRAEGCPRLSTVLFGLSGIKAVVRLLHVLQKLQRMCATESLASQIDGEICTSG